VELSCHLRLQLEVGRIATLVVEFATTIQLTSNIKLPKFEWSLIRESEQTFIAGCKRLLAQLAIISTLNVVQTEGCCGRHATKQ